MVKSDFPYNKELLLEERIRSVWEQFFPLREVPISKRDAIEENQWLIQKSPFDVRDFFGVLATPLYCMYVGFRRPQT